MIKANKLAHNCNRNGTKVIIIMHDIKQSTMITKKTAILKVRINEKEKDNLKAKAEKQGLTLSKFVRSKLLDNYLNI